MHAECGPAYHHLIAADKAPSTPALSTLPLRIECGVSRAGARRCGTGPAAPRANGQAAGAQEPTAKRQSTCATHALPRAAFGVLREQRASARLRAGHAASQHAHPRPANWNLSASFADRGGLVEETRACVRALVARGGRVYRAAFPAPNTVRQGGGGEVKPSRRAPHPLRSPHTRLAHLCDDMALPRRPCARQCPGPP